MSCSLMNEGSHLKMSDYCLMSGLAFSEMQLENCRPLAYACLAPLQNSLIEAEIFERDSNVVL